MDFIGDRGLAGSRRLPSALIVEMAGGRLLSLPRLVGRISSSELDSSTERSSIISWPCFFASCSITAAYNISMSLCREAASLSKTIWSNEPTLWTVGLAGLLSLLTDDGFLKPLNQDLVVEAGEIGVSSVALLVGLKISISRLDGEDSVRRRNRLPTVRRRTRAMRTKPMYAPRMPQIWYGRSLLSREAWADNGGPSSGEGVGA
jgi:hypothetical protein